MPAVPAGGTVSGADFDTEREQIQLEHRAKQPFNPDEGYDCPRCPTRTPMETLSEDDGTHVLWCPQCGVAIAPATSGEVIPLEPGFYRIPAKALKRESEAAPDSDSAFTGAWCFLELMGHRKLAGFVSEGKFAGAVFVRIDVPGDDRNPPATQLYSPSAVYAMTPTSEDLARRFASRVRPEPVHRFELAQNAGDGFTDGDGR